MAIHVISYLSENDDTLLVVFIGGDVKHGASITRHDGVLHFGVPPDVQVMGFDSPHGRAHCGGLGDSEVKETCQQTDIRPGFSHSLSLLDLDGNTELFTSCLSFSLSPTRGCLIHPRASSWYALSEVRLLAIGMTLFNFVASGHQGCSATYNWLAKPVRSTNTRAHRLQHSWQHKSPLTTQEGSYKPTKSGFLKCDLHQTINRNWSLLCFARCSNNSVCSHQTHERMKLNC